MNNNKAVGIENYADFLQQISTLFSLTLPEIRDKYSKYPHCLIDYFENDVTEKSIEVRFDKNEYTLTCIFKSEEKCSSIYLFPDKDEMIEQLIFHLKENYDYSFIKNRWSVQNYYIKIRELTKSFNDAYIIFYL